MPQYSSCAQLTVTAHYTIEYMDQSATQLATNDSQPTVDAPAITARQRLDELRSLETTRRGADQTLRRRMTLAGAVIGIMVAFLVGYLGIAITVADEGARDFGFRFFKPDLANFLRASTAYIFSGAVGGAALTNLVAISRSTASNPFVWLGAGIVSIIATPLLIGLTLPLTILIFFDFFEGLKPGLWASAFTQEFLGSFFSGYLYMVNIVYAGAIGAIVFVLATGLSAWAWIKDPAINLIENDRVRSTIYICALAALTAIPFLVLVFGPLDLLRSLTAFLTGERLV